MKRGLKSKHLHKEHSLANVKDPSPMKRGLKCAAELKVLAKLVDVKDPSPMKRGLKQPREQATGYRLQ